MTRAPVEMPRVQSVGAEPVAIGFSGGTITLRPPTIGQAIRFVASKDACSTSIVGADGGPHHLAPGETASFEVRVRHEDGAEVAFWARCEGT